MTYVTERTVHIKNAIEGIHKGFDWNETNEGAQFWGTVIDLLRDHLAVECARQADAPIDELLLNRRQTRSMSTQELTEFYAKPPMVYANPSVVRPAPKQHWLGRFVRWLFSWWGN